MEALKCIVCGTRHWPRQRCPSSGQARGQRSAKREPVKQDLVVNTPPVNTAPVNTKPVNKEPVNTAPVNKPIPVNSAPDRKAYMRDYMRRRRAEAKAAAGTQ
jgi:hypothetical protein